MMRSALAIVLLAAAGVCSAQTDDSRKYHLVTVTQSPMSPAGDRLMAAMRDPVLQPIANTCKVFHFKTRDEIYRLRYSPALPASQVPIVALVRWDGGVVYKASGDRIPRDPQRLASMMQRMAEQDQRHPDRMPDHRLMMQGAGDVQQAIPDTVLVRPDLEAPDAAAVVAVVSVCAGVMLLILIGGAAAVAGVLMLTRRKRR